MHVHHPVEQVGTDPVWNRENGNGRNEIPPLQTTSRPSWGEPKVSRPITDLSSETPVNVVVDSNGPSWGTVRANLSATDENVFASFNLGANPRQKPKRQLGDASFSTSIPSKPKPPPTEDMIWKSPQRSDASPIRFQRQQEEASKRYDFISVSGPNPTWKPSEPPARQVAPNRLEPEQPLVASPEKRGRSPPRNREPLRWSLDTDLKKEEPRNTPWNSRAFRPPPGFDTVQSPFLSVINDNPPPDRYASCSFTSITFFLT
jgi:hypothetical protein